jgi:hypothetical protein
MRVVFGVVGLLLALAIVGLVAKQQLRAAGTPRIGAAPAAAGASTSGTVAGTSRQVQQQIQVDLGKALEQGARKDEAGQ